jgi:hypothetical protein
MNFNDLEQFWLNQGTISVFASKENHSQDSLCPG